MKFTNGYWLNKKKYTIQSPKEYHSHRRKNAALEVFAPYKHMQERGHTLNIGMSTLAFSTPREDIIKVRTYHFDQKEQFPEFDVAESNIEGTIEETESCLRYTSGKLQAELSKKGNFELRFYGDSSLLTKSEYGAQGEIQSSPSQLTDAHELYQTQGPHFMREQLSLAPDELIYGLGERFTPFIKNGQEINSWNEDPGTGSEQAYKNIPFYLSNKGYGVFVNHPEQVSFEIASENVSRVQFSVEGEGLEYYVIYGPSTKEILQKYTDLTGKPALPPAWSFGLWLSTSFTTDYSEQTVMHFIDEMQQRDIPFDVFHFDTFWMKAFEWCSFEWNEELFPDPQGLIDRIHQKGLKICLWINPYIGQKSPLFQECKENGYFLTQPNGEVWQWDFWQAGQGIIDFTNPAAKAWYKQHLSRLLDMGIDCFKTDFGERIPDNAVYYDGSNPKKAHNYYSYLYNETVFNLLKEKKGTEEAVVFARSATAGSQKFPVHWGGDNLSQYTSMAESLRGGLSFLLSGFGFWSHDIGGFEESASPDIYKRWTQFGLLSTHSRYHGNIEYRVPWHYGEEAVAVTRKFSKLKNSLMPYLYTEAVKTSQTGIPMMRPLFMENEDDPTTFYIDKQYYLGDCLLVSPIFNEQGRAHYYLPQGKWTHLLDRRYRELSSGSWQQETYDYFSLPVFVKENTILIKNSQDHSADYVYQQDAIVSLYQLAEGCNQAYVLDAAGQRIAQVEVERSKETYTIHLQGFTGKTIIEVFDKDQYLCQQTAGKTVLELTMETI